MLTAVRATHVDGGAVYVDCRAVFIDGGAVYLDCGAVDVGKYWSCPC